MTTKAHKNLKTVGAKPKLSAETIAVMAKRWLKGEEMNELAKEVGITWQTLAGHFIAAGHRAKHRTTAKVKLTAKIVKAMAKRWEAGESMQDLADEVGVSWQTLAGYIARKKVARTYKWSIIMTRWLISSLQIWPKWNLVTFTGPKGHEAVGIVDILAVRKDHSPGEDGLKPGDRLEIILIQVKGGKAKPPKSEDIDRLRLLKGIYGARDVVLVEWERGLRLDFSRLQDTGNDWKRHVNPRELFK